MKLFLYKVEHNNQFCEPLTEVVQAETPEQADRLMGFKLLAETETEDLAQPAGELEDYTADRVELRAGDGPGLCVPLGGPVLVRFVWTGTDWVA